MSRGWGQKRDVQDIVERLRKNDPGKTVFVMSSRRFGDEQSLLLCEALAENNTVEEFLASGHRISRIGAQNFAIALRRNKTLRRLAIGDCTFGDDSALALLEDWKNSTLHELDLELKGIGLTTCDALRNILVEAPHALQYLNLGRNNLNDADIVALSEGISTSAALKRLDLHQNKIGQTGCAALGRALKKGGYVEKKRFSICLDENRISSAGLIALLAQGETASDKSIRVSHLSLESCSIGDEGIKGLCNSIGNDPVFSSLEVLKLSKNEICCGKALGCLCEHPGNSLRVLSVGLNPLKLKGALDLSNSIKKLPLENTLKELDLTGVLREGNSEQDLDTLLTNLAESKCLENLSLLGSKLGNDGARRLCSALQNNVSLRTLSLSCTEVSDEGVSDILQALANNSTLATLEFGGNDITENGKRLIEEFRKTKPALDIYLDMAENAAQSKSQV